MVRGLLYARDYKITDHITIRIPTVGEILDNEADYYKSVSLFVSTPWDMMVPLEDAHIDFTKITNWDLFTIMFHELKERDLSLIVGDLNLKDYALVRSKQNGNIILRNDKTGSVIDMAIHERICRFLCSLLKIERKNKRPAGEETKKYLLDRERKRLARATKRPPPPSQLETLIVTMVNAPEFPYNYETVRGISIYQFYVSVAQVINRVRYDKLMIGCYAGTVDIKKMEPDALSWIPKEI